MRSGALKQGNLMDAVQNELL